MRNGPLYWMSGLHLGRRHVGRWRHRRTGHDADRAVAGRKRDRYLGQPGDLIQGLEKRLVAQVEVERGVGDLGAESARAGR